MIKFFKRIFGTGARAFVALVGIAGITVSVANYTATQGVGTDFGSRVNSAVHYAQQLICDMNTTGSACAAVAAGNTITSTMTAIAVGGTITANQGGTPWPVSLTSTAITGTVAATQSGTWTVQPGNTANTTPWLVTVNNTLTAISMGDGITTGNFPSGSPVFAGLFNGTTYDRPRSAGPTGFTGVTVTPVSLANGHALLSGTTTAMVGLTSTQLITAIASVRIYVNRIKCNNTSSTATLVQIRDGSAGSILDTLAAGATYGGEQGTGSTPLFWTTAGTALFAQNVTTGASVICTASGYSG